VTSSFLKNVFCCANSKIFLLNLGTGSFPNIVNEKNGLLSWASNIVNTLITGTEYNELYQVSLILPKENYYVIDIPLNNAYLPDDISEKTIIYYINTTNQWIQDNDDLLNIICDKLLQNLKHKY
jgi:hypothetical protein